MVTPGELANLTKRCRVCRLFIVADQCFSGGFVRVPNDSTHANSAAYTASDSTEQTEASEYADNWLRQDPASRTMNGMHEGIGQISSHKQSREGAPGVGNRKLCECCGPVETRQDPWGRIKSRYR